jgi:hypothetical protein
MIVPLIGLFKKDYVEVFIHISTILKRISNLMNRLYIIRHCMDFDQDKFEPLPWKQCSFEWTQCSTQGIIWDWKDKFAWFLFGHSNSPWSSYGKHHLVQKNWFSTYSYIRRANFLNVSSVYSLVWHVVSYHWETSQVLGLCLENIGQPNMAQSLTTSNIQTWLNAMDSP